MAALSRLADETLTAAYDIALAGLPHSAAPPRLAVVAMGKCGGNELNYVSDVDVIFVAAGDEDLSAGTIVAARLIEICGQVAAALVTGNAGSGSPPFTSSSTLPLRGTKVVSIASTAKVPLPCISKQPS